jgi:hypothetical protein
MVMAYALWSSYNLCLVLLKYMVTRYLRISITGGELM